MAKQLKEKEIQVRYTDMEFDRALMSSEGVPLVRIVKQSGSTTCYLNKPSEISYDEFQWVILNLFKEYSKKEEKEQIRTFSL